MFRNGAERVSAMAEGRYYWLKLRRDFFKRHDIQIVESMPNGKDYVLFYLKLLVESIDHEGALRFSDTIPYNEQMLSVITGTNIDVVRAAMSVFGELGMIELLDDSTIFMRETQTLIGSETKWAEKKRAYRAKKDNVPQLSPTGLPCVRQEIETEKEKELETEKDKEVYASIVSHLNQKAGTGYKHTSKKTQSLIKARLNEGFSIEDFKRVIDNMCAEWIGDEKMQQYLRPETLFGTKFEGYLNRKTRRAAQQSRTEADDLDGIL